MVIKSSPSRLGPLLASVLVIGSAEAASAATVAPPPIVEFAVPTSNSGPGSITAGPDGNLWFTEKTGNKIGRISASGSFPTFSLAAGALFGGIPASAENWWSIQ